MAMPEKYKRYMSEDAWDGLALHQLRPIFRESVMTVLETGLRNSGGDEQDVDVVLGLVQDYADDLRDASKLDWTGLDDDDIKAGQNMADYIAELAEDEDLMAEVEGRGEEDEKEERDEE